MSRIVPLGVLLALAVLPGAVCGLGFRLKGAMTRARGLQMAAVGSSPQFTLGVLGDLHLDPRNMEEHLQGRDHFEKILRKKSGELRHNTAVVSLGDLG